MLFESLVCYQGASVCYLQEQGISVLNNAIKACTEEIERHKGKLTVKEAPRAVSSISYFSFAFVTIMILQPESTTKSSFSFLNFLKIVLCICVLINEAFV